MSEEKKNPNPEQNKVTDEDVTIYEQALSIDRSRQKSRKIFVFYVIALFCVALGLILLSYVMQAHANRQLEDLGTQLTQQTNAAAGAKAKADQLQATIDAMQRQLEQNEKEAQELTKSADEQKKSAEALDSLWKLERAWQQGEDASARSIIEQMDKAYTRGVLTDSTKQPLTGDAAKEYAAICADLEKE
ncbi:MAG TPA: hypothetical protein DDX51_03085 [Clostridiales bacterium]|nr:hypothetical protein [Clostridiales bacterium]